MWVAGCERKIPMIGLIWRIVHLHQVFLQKKKTTYFPFFFHCFTKYLEIFVFRGLGWNVWNGMVRQWINYETWTFWHPPPPLRLGPMNSCSSSSQFVRPSVCLQQTFVAICSSAFTKILHSNRNLETERSDESVFSRTIFVLNLAKRAQNVVFLSFYKILWLLFPGNNLKWKTLKICFPVQTLYLTKFWGTSLGPNALFQSNYRCLWLSVSPEGMHQFLWLFTWIYSARKSSLWEYYFWLGISRHAQQRPNLPRLTRAPCG